MNEETISQLEREVEKLPSSLRDEFHRAAEALALIFKDDELTSWALEGLAIAKQTPRSWEAGVEYFRASKEVAKILPFSAFIQWARCGTYLTQDSPTLAVSYFKASPSIVSNLRPQYISRWAGLGRSMYKGTWKSSTLAAKFFEVSPTLIRDLPFWDLEVFSTLIEHLSSKSYDLAIECLMQGGRALGRIGKEREPVLSLCRTLAETRWQDVKGCLEVIGKALPPIEETERSRFLRLAEQLARSGVRNTPAFLVNGSTALSHVSPRAQGHVLDLCETLFNIFPPAVYALLKSLDLVLSRITLNQLDDWFERGVRLLKDNPESGLAYFKVESTTSEQVLETLSSSLELERVKGVLRLYCRALSGVDVEIMSSKDLAHKGIGWVSESHAFTEGTKVFLSPVVDYYPSKEENFIWFKVVSTHQVAHLEFGSFLFAFDKPSHLFRDTRVEREERALASVQENHRIEAQPEDAKESWITDMGRFFSLFSERKLALDIFTILEDGRLDCQVKEEYPGIARSYRKIQAHALQGRQQMAKMPVRQAMVELLVRFSLEQYRNLEVPKGYMRTAIVLAKIQKRLLNSAATVEDTSEACVRAYDVLSRTPNEEEPQEEWETHDFDEIEEFSEEELEELLEKLAASGQDEPRKGQTYEPPQDVEFRGDFKPELVQMLNRMRMDQAQQNQGDTQLITKEMLEQLLSQSAELDMNAEADKFANAIGLFAQNLMKEAGMTTPSSLLGQGYGPIAHVDEQGGSLETREPKTYVYDEWDFRVGDYKPKWCIVREKIIEEGDVQFFNDTLRNYAALLSDIKRQFELVIPETFRKVRRLPDGEEIDLDAAIEAAIERRSGITPLEKVYWLRNKVERDVAVVFLLDMSASTAEAIDEGSPIVYDQEAPDDPVEYMMWLRSRREGMVRRHYKRIIDLEKEGTALLLQALENIADTYGIYGFSGYGRENVEFYVIKDVNQPLTESVKRRIDKISPLHATRMGPAIRHATSKLEQQEAKTKILFLISDGRPQDRGYSREGVEKEYAIHDTHMALVEARMKAITPFCLTVDKAGHDYLRSMCGDMNYEVLADIWTLPQRLPQLYRSLTI